MLSSPTTTGARVVSPIKNIYVKLATIDIGKYTFNSYERFVSMNGQTLVNSPNGCGPCFKVQFPMLQRSILHVSVTFSRSFLRSSEFFSIFSRTLFSFSPYRTRLTALIFRFHFDLKLLAIVLLSVNTNLQVVNL